MAQRRAPFWLAVPGRFAGVERGRAVIALAVMAVVVMLLALAPAPQDSAGDEAAAIAVYDSVIDGMRAGGGGYYALLADNLRANALPMRPALAFRLPTHAVVQALLPRDVVVAALYLLVAGVAAVWWTRLAEALPRAAARVSAMILLGAGLIATATPGLIGFHELWAGLLIALSLGLRRANRWVEAVALGLIAALVRESTILYLILMAALALAENGRREACGWGAAIAVFALVMLAHAAAVAQVTGPLDPPPQHWATLAGPGIVTAALIAASALRELPAWIAAPLAALALVGWSGWRDPLALRAGATLGGFATAAAILAAPGSFYWVMMVAPLWLVGLVFLPDLARDLRYALLDRVRVRVQRISQ